MTNLNDIANSGPLYRRTTEHTTGDAVHHPEHYNRHPSGVECVTIIEHMNFCLGNAVKYIWRAGEKDPATELEDLKKARWYLDREIARLERQPKHPRLLAHEAIERHRAQNPVPSTPEDSLFPPHIKQRVIDALGWWENSPPCVDLAQRYADEERTEREAANIKAFDDAVAEAKPARAVTISVEDGRVPSELPRTCGEASS